MTLIKETINLTWLFHISFISKYELYFGLDLFSVLGTPMSQDNHNFKEENSPQMEPATLILVSHCAQPNADHVCKLHTFKVFL